MFERTSRGKDRARATDCVKWVLIFALLYIYWMIHKVNNSFLSDLPKNLYRYRHIYLCWWHIEGNADYHSIIQKSKWHCLWIFFWISQVSTLKDNKSSTIQLLVLLLSSLVIEWDCDFHLYLFSNANRLDNMAHFALFQNSVGRHKGRQSYFLVAFSSCMMYMYVCMYVGVKEYNYLGTSYCHIMSHHSLGRE